MKLKMAQNSLFAILLRSPWWVSLLIAALMAAAAAALLPQAYRVVGMLSGFPLLVVAGMAAWRQAGQASPAQVQALQQTLGGLTWPLFSQQLEQAFTNQGYQVQRGVGDAVDFRLERGGRVTLVSARRWKSARTGLESLRSLQVARQAAAAESPTDAIYIGLGELSTGARTYATQQRLTLWQAPELASLLGKHKRAR